MLKAGACAAGMVACTETSGTTVPAPTLITARPNSFLGSVSCIPDGGPGQLQSYIVTLTDLTPNEGGTSPPPSRPTSCALSVSFASPPLGLNHLFVGRIDGYDLGPDALLETGTLPAPRWTTTCGIPPAPIEADVEPDAEPGEVDASPALDAAALYSPTRAIQYVQSDLLACLPMREVPPMSVDGGTVPADAEVDANAADGTSVSADAEAGAADVSQGGDAHADAADAAEGSVDSSAADVIGLDTAAPDTAVPDGGAPDSVFEPDAGATDADLSDQRAADAAELDVTEPG